MAKKCKLCERAVFSKGYCLFHSPKKPLKKGNSKLKKGGRIKPISEKGKEKKVLKTQRTKEIHLAMYNWWLKQDKNQCMSCGCNLPNEFHTWMVDHLIEKSQRQDLALEEWNFYLTCFNDHSSKTSGFPHPKHLEAIKKAKEYDGFRTNWAIDCVKQVEMHDIEWFIHEYGYNLTEEQFKEITKDYGK